MVVSATRGQHASAGLCGGGLVAGPACGADCTPSRPRHRAVGGRVGLVYYLFCGLVVALDMAAGAAVGAGHWGVDLDGRHLVPTSGGLGGVARLSKATG